MRSITLSLATASAITFAVNVNPSQVSAAACVQQNVPAHTIHAALPVEPSAAAKHGTKGTVSVTVGLDSSGAPTSAKVSRSTDPRLNDAAIHAALASTYAPALRACRPIASSYVYTVASDSIMP